MHPVEKCLANALIAFATFSRSRGGCFLPVQATQSGFRAPKKAHKAVTLLPASHQRWERPLEVADFSWRGASIRSGDEGYGG